MNFIWKIESTTTPALSCEILLMALSLCTLTAEPVRRSRKTLTGMLRGVVGGGARVLPSLSSSCGSSASMASMVAEGGGGGEQVTPDKAMQMQNAASLQGMQRLGVRPEWDTHVDRRRSQTQRSATCISTERVSDNTEAGDDPSKETDGDTETGRATGWVEGALF